MTAQLTFQSGRVIGWHGRRIATCGEGRCSQIYIYQQLDTDELVWPIDSFYTYLFFRHMEAIQKENRKRFIVCMKNYILLDIISYPLFADADTGI